MIVFAAAPRLLSQVADSALRGDVANASAETRNLALTQIGRVPPNRPGVTSLIDLGAEYADALPASVTALAPERVTIAETARLTVADAGGRPVGTGAGDLLALRVQTGLDDRVRYVAGRAPGAASATIQVPDVDASGPRTATQFEAALSSASAASMGIELGQTYTLAPDTLDVLARGHDARLAIKIVGLYDVLDPQAAYWSGEVGAIAPQIVTKNADTTFLFASALLAPNAYPALFDASRDRLNVSAGAALPFRYAWRLIVDPVRLDADTADSLLRDLRRTDTLVASDPVFDGQVSLLSGLVGLVDRHVTAWRSALTVLTTVAVGPVAVAIAALVLISLFAARRRQAALATWLGRGASRGQVATAIAIEAMILTLPGALLGGLVVELVAPAGSPLPSVLVGLAIVVLAIVVNVAASLRTTTGRGGQLDDRAAGIGRRPTQRRIVFEALVVVVAALGAYLLRERGVHGSSSATALTTSDPLIAGVPVLVGAAAGLVAVRIVPVPLRALAVGARWRRDLVPVLGLRHAVRGGDGGPVLIVLLATSAIGAFCASALVQLDRSAEAIAWHDVGAPVRVSADTALPAGFDLASIAGPGTRATMSRLQVPIGHRGSTLDLLVVDAPGLQVVDAGTLADPQLPEALLGPAGPPLPAIVSNALLGVAGGLELDTPVDVSVLGRAVRIRPVEARDAFPTVDSGDPFVVVSRDQLTAAYPDVRPPVSSIAIRADRAYVAAIEASVAATHLGLHVDTAWARAASLRGGPIVGAVASGIGASAAVAAAYGALALAMALALAGAARAREAAQLRTLGVTARELMALMIAEHGPTVAVAFVAGVALGFGLFAVVEPGLGLRGLLGSSLAVPFAITLDELGILLIATLLVAAFGLSIGIVLQRRVVLAAAMRLGAE